MPNHEQNSQDSDGIKRPVVIDTEHGHTDMSSFEDAYLWSNDGNFIGGNDGDDYGGGGGGGWDNSREPESNPLKYAKRLFHAGVCAGFMLDVVELFDSGARTFSASDAVVNYDFFANIVALGAVGAAAGLCIDVVRAFRSKDRP